MIKKVLGYIKEHNLIEPGQGIVVGVSGGADSVALIHLLAKIRKFIPMDLSIAHIDHGIRGHAAKEDALFVKTMATELGLDFYLKEAQIPELAQKWGLSGEEAGRRVRYGFFEDVRKKVDGDRIALAHHKDDQSETILYNIIRGTGLTGLSGMAPIRNGRIIRPLLEVSRQEVEDYCHKNVLFYRDDHTNEDVTYTRNRIRHRVIPMIERHFNPAFKDALVRMGDMLRDDERFLSDYAESAFQKIAQLEGSQVRIDLLALNGYPKSIKGRILRYGLHHLRDDLADIQYKHIEGIMDLAKSENPSSVIDLPKGLRARREYSFLVLFMGELDSPRLGDNLMPDFEYELNVSGRTLIPQINGEIAIERLTKFQVLKGSRRCIYIDGDGIKGGLYVRNRRDGDRFRPLGMVGTKKLKDFFIDKKVPRHKRGSIPLVVHRNNIIWVVGYQMSEDYKVTGESKDLLKLSYKIMPIKDQR